MARYAASGQTVTEFCKAEQVSQPSFYHWKKKLGDRGTSQRTGQPAFQKVRVVEGQVSPMGLSIRLPNNVEIVVGPDLRLVELALDKMVATYETGLGG